MRSHVSLIKIIFGSQLAAIKIPTQMISSLFWLKCAVHAINGGPVCRRVISCPLLQSIAEMLVHVHGNSAYSMLTQQETALGTSTVTQQETALCTTTWPFVQVL